MRVHSLCRGALLGLWVFLLLATFCSADDKKVEVVGVGECADCKDANIKTSQALSGLRVTIDCKVDKGGFKTRGVGELDEEGKFKVTLPQEILKDGKLEEECYAQLHSASAAPCPVHNGLENSKIIFHSKTDKKHTFVPTGKLKFSTALCTSAFLWPHYKYPSLPKLPPLHKWKKPLPKLSFPPFKKFGHSFPPIYKKPLPPFPPIHKKPLPPFPPIHKKPLPPLPPIHKKPLPPPVPIYKPKPPVYKPLPPPVPIYKPKPPVYKPLPPPVPIYKPKPPVYKPKPPVYKKPLPPIYKPHPIPKVLPPPFPFHKPLPPFPKIPPFYKKPCPPFKHPHIPKIPPKYFHHPKFGSIPPLPYFPHP